MKYIAGATTVGVILGGLAGRWSRAGLTMMPNVTIKMTATATAIGALRCAQ
jgi:hypothetical protein